MAQQKQYSQSTCDDNDVNARVLSASDSASDDCNDNKAINNNKDTSNIKDEHHKGNNNNDIGDALNATSGESGNAGSNDNNYNNNDEADISKDYSDNNNYIYANTNRGTHSSSNSSNNGCGSSSSATSGTATTDVEVTNNEIKSTTANDATGKGDEGLANRRQVSWADEIPAGQLATKHVSARLRYAPGHRRCKRRAKPMSNDDDIKWRNDRRRRVRLRRVLKQVQEVDGMVTEV